MLLLQLSGFLHLTVERRGSLEYIFCSNCYAKLEIINNDFVDLILFVPFDVGYSSIRPIRM